MGIVVGTIWPNLLLLSGMLIKAAHYDRKKINVQINCNPTYIHVLRKSDIVSIEEISNWWLWAEDMIQTLSITNANLVRILWKETWTCYHPSHINWGGKTHYNKKEKNNNMRIKQNHIAPQREKAWTWAAKKKFVCCYNGSMSAISKKNHSMSQRSQALWKLETGGAESKDGKK